MYLSSVQIWCEQKVAQKCFDYKKHPTKLGAIFCALNEVGLEFAGNTAASFEFLGKSIVNLIFQSNELSEKYFFLGVEKLGTAFLILLTSPFLFLLSVTYALVNPNDHKPLFGNARMKLLSLDTLA